MGGLGWAGFWKKTMGGLGQDLVAHGLTFLSPARPIRSSVLYEKVLLPKFNITNFWKRGSMHSEVLFQMRLLSNFSITLIRLACLTDVYMPPRSGIVPTQKNYTIKKFQYHEKIAHHR
jgi:hypothetical protein